jgi:hypothetical protein
MAVQVAASIAITTATTTATAAGSAILFTILHDVFTPDRDSALGAVLNHQFFHEVVPPLRRALARREGRHRHGPVSGAEAPSLRRALAVTVAITGNAARFAHAHAVTASTAP